MNKVSGILTKVLLVTIVLLGVGCDNGQAEKDAQAKAAAEAKKNICMSFAYGAEAKAKCNQ